MRVGCWWWVEGVEGEDGGDFVIVVAVDVSLDVEFFGFDFDGW